jgi:hypothetical protein
MKIQLAIWLILLALAAAPLAAQEIYRVVDENGNVTYTDQKPNDNADPMDLPELNVLGDDEAAAEVITAEPESETAQPLNFRITSPTDGETLAGEAIQVEMDIGIEIPPTAQIVLFLNGQPQEPIRTLDITLDQIPPGPYQLRAELQTPEGRKIAETGSVRFEVTADGGETDLP